MKLTEIIGKDTSSQKAIEILKNRATPAPDIKECKKQFNPYKDPVYNLMERPDKFLREDSKDPEKVTRIQKVNRIALDLSNIIVERAVAFLFGNDVKINTEIANDTQQLVLDAVTKVLSDNYEFALNREIARETFKVTEAAECWYPVDAPEGFDSYGFSSKKKLRKTIFSAKNGDTLYPLFDSYGDMIAFSRSYIVTQPNGRSTEYFETYTSEEKQVWKRDKVIPKNIIVTGNLSGEWEQLTPEIIPIGRIPIVYAHQDETEVNRVVDLIHRLNKLLSNFAETNDYFASPKLFFIGKLLGMPARSDGGQILQGDEKSEAKYLSWDQAPESVRLEIDTLLNQIYSLTQTPNISFDNVKGINQLSGITLKLLFLDAHLKVKNKEEIFVPYIQRRYRIIASYIGEMNNSLKKEANRMTFEPVITPYMINDLLNEVNTLVSATGGKAVMAQKTAIRILGQADDVDAEYEQIQQETQQENTFNAFEPTV